MPAYHYQPGDQPLEGYTIRHALGRGGFGEVYFAISDAGREVALKAVQNYEDIELRGIGHCMNLKSPHLVMIFDVKRGADGTPWVIMEYVSGSSLRDILDASDEGIDPDQAMFFVRQLARGIDYLHDAGIVHRDLKPHNVFFEDGIVKIGDYSLSKVITYSHASGHTMTVGSVHYMAPEISLGRYDKTVDLYALGVMLYEMLTGKPPFVGESVGEVLMKHLQGDIDVSALETPNAEVVRKAMARDPAMRYQSAREMVEALPGTDSDGLCDSAPASLSLVGKHVPAALNAATNGHQPRSHPPLGDTIGSGDATSDTAESQRRTRHLPADESADATRWRMATIGDLFRVALSAIATIALMTLGFSLSTEAWINSGITGLEIATIFFSLWIVSILITLVLLFVAPRERGVAATITSRAALLGLSAAGLYALHRFSDQSPVSGILTGCFLGALASMMVLDWRAFINLRRSARVLTVRTLVAGGISGSVAAMIDQSLDHLVLIMAATTSAAITVQLVSPWLGPGGSQGAAGVSVSSHDAGLSHRPEQESMDLSCSVPPPTAERATL